MSCLYLSTFIFLLIKSTFSDITIVTSAFYISFFLISNSKIVFLWVSVQLKVMYTHTKKSACGVHLQSCSLPHLTLATAHLFSITLVLTFQEFRDRKEQKMLLSETGFFHSGDCIWESPKLFHVSLVHSLLLLCINPIVWLHQFLFYSFTRGRILNKYS